MLYKVEFVKYDKRVVTKYFKSELSLNNVLKYISDCMFTDDGFQDMTWYEVRLLRIESRDGKKKQKRLPYNPKRKLDALEMLGGKCVKCESTSNLEFDHIDPETKSFNIASNWSRAWDDLVEELNKCQLLCGECHNKKSVEERDGPSHGTVYMYREYKCRCEPCREAKRRSEGRGKKIG